MSKTGPGNTKAEDAKAKRLSAALRANLHRRKAQKRARQTSETESPAKPSRDSTS